MTVHDKYCYTRSRITGEQNSRFAGRNGKGKKKLTLAHEKENPEKRFETAANTRACYSTSSISRKQIPWTANCMPS